MKNADQEKTTREKIIEAYQSGLTCKEISPQYPEVAIATVYRWVWDYKTEGRTQKKVYKPQKIKKHYVDQVIELYKSGLNYQQIHRVLPEVTPMSARRWVIACFSTAEGR